MESPASSSAFDHGTKANPMGMYTLDDKHGELFK